MKIVKIKDQDYELIKDYKNGFEMEETESKLTEYFDGYDYILGDWSYGKLRLKGFCDKDNKIFKPINDIESADEYIKENCAYECRYFILKRVK